MSLSSCKVPSLDGYAHHWGRKDLLQRESNDSATSAVTGVRGNSWVIRVLVVEGRSAVVRQRFLFGSPITDLKEPSVWRRSDELGSVQF
jgi:hypothetical protein